MSRIDHLSYSAIITFLRNQVEFQKRYIAKVYDNEKSPAMVVGTAFHKAMEDYYRPGTDVSMHDAVEAGLAVINNTSDYEMNYGKTGSREKMISEYTNLVNKYFEEAQTYNVIEVEKRMEHTINSVPMVGVSDLVIRSESNKLQVKDYKTVMAYSCSTNDPDDPEYVENYKYLLQGYIYLALAEAEYGEEVESVEFLEVKKSINRDGTPQVRGFEYDRKSLLEFASVAHKIITNVFSYVNDDNAKFFPNPSDYINGLESMQVVSNMEEGFDAAKIRRKVNSAEKFAPKNITIDVTEDTGTSEEMILRKFIEFGIGGINGKTYEGASVIRYTFKPNRGVSMSSIAKRSDDIAIALQAKSVRIEAPIFGTDLVGVEVPNPNRKKIDLVDDKHLRKGTTLIPIGEDIFGEVHYGDITKMPHLLIAGQTGSGKSVMLNVILHSLIEQLTPDQLQLVLIDPKQVELAMFDNVPHLYRPIITDTVRATQALDEMVQLMEKRYEILREAKVRSIDDYKGEMPRIIVVIDEFADLIMMANNKKQTFEINSSELAKSIISYSQHASDLNQIDLDFISAKLPRNASDQHKEMQKQQRETLKDLQKMILAASESDTPPAEHSIIRIAQKARAVGIHLVLATQRPSADVVTGLIKANIPTKIAFAVTTSMNSRIILDEVGAEQLTGYGDMLYLDPSARHLERLQGLYK